MNKFHPSIVCGVLVMGTALAMAAPSTRQVNLAIAAGGVVSVVNNCGSVTIHQGSQRLVVVNATKHSDKVEVDAANTLDGNRVEIRTHSLPQQQPSREESKVDYDVAVPPGISVIVSTATAPITLDNVSGDVSLSSDTGLITVRNVGNSYLRIRGVAAPVVLSNITGHVEVTSSGGSVQLTKVSGPKVTVGTTSGNITYAGGPSPVRWKMIILFRPSRT